MKGKETMEWKLKDQAFIRNLFREMADEAVKNKDRIVTISHYEDSVTVSVTPLIEEKLSEEEEYKQYCKDDIEWFKQYDAIKSLMYKGKHTGMIFSVDYILPEPYHTVTAMCCVQGACVDSCRAFRRTNGNWCDMNGNTLPFTPTHWTIYGMEV